MNKAYYDLIEETRDDQTIHSLELVDDGEEYIPSSEVNDCAINFMDTLRMENAPPEQPVYELVPMPKPESGKDKHVTADTIISLPDCDGMSEEFLLTQPLDAIHMYLEEIAEEVAS